MNKKLILNILLGILLGAGIAYIYYLAIGKSDNPLFFIFYGGLIGALLFSRKFLNKKDRQKSEKTI